MKSCFWDKNCRFSENGFVQENLDYFLFEQRFIIAGKKILVYREKSVNFPFFTTDNNAEFYFKEVKTNPNNYDAWFDYLRLMESESDPDSVREVYERAIANVPPAEEKRLWRRYIYLWINYALYEELIAKVSLVYY